MKYYRLIAAEAGVKVFREEICSSVKDATQTGALCKYPQIVYFSLVNYLH